jgi:hypothetical protein
LPSSTPQAPSEAERATHIHLADTDNRIDGISRDPATDAIFNAYLNGEITVAEIIPRLHALLGL